MASPAMQLVGGTAIDSATGEIPDEQTKDERILELEEQLAGAELELRSKRGQITKLMKARIDEDESARKSYPERQLIEKMFALWQDLLGHTAAKLTPRRFDEAADRIAEGYGEEAFTMALYGLKEKAWRDREGVLHDDWKVVMKDGSQVEAYANRCPAEKRSEIRGTLFEVVS